MQNVLKILKKGLLERNKLLTKLSKDKYLKSFLSSAAAYLNKSIRDNEVVFTAGNGGSKSHADHLTAELVGRYKKNRRPFNSISLGSNASLITCIGNDFGFDEIFSREFEANNKYGDILFVFTTSGSSPNILKLLQKANELNMVTFVITGNTGGAAKTLADYSYIVPSNDTALIQDAHQIILHLLCEMIDDET